MEALLSAEGFERMALFFTLFKFWRRIASGSRCRSKALTTNAPSPNGSRGSWLISLRTLIVRTCLAARWRRLKGMGLSAFSRLFERHVKCSCVEYINHLRIYKACQLLIETDDHITSIGLRVGYDTLSTFNRNFIRLIGRTPSSFRAERRPADPTSPTAKRQGNEEGRANGYRGRPRSAGNRTAPSRQLRGAHGRRPRYAAIV